MTDQGNRERSRESERRVARPERARSASAQDEPEERGDEKRRAEIYRSAAKIFHQKGFHATSINDIADAVGLTKAGLYYYIRGKQDLLFAIMSYAMDQLDQHVIEPASRETDPRERLATVVENHARLITVDGGALTILVNELEGLFPEHHDEIARRQREYVDFIEEILVALDERGLLREVHPTVGAFSLVGMILWISRWFRRDGRLPGEQVVAEVRRMALASVLRTTPEP